MVGRGYFGWFRTWKRKRTGAEENNTMSEGTAFLRVDKSNGIMTERRKPGAWWLHSCKHTFMRTADKRSGVDAKCSVQRQ